MDPLASLMEAGMAPTQETEEPTFPAPEGFSAPDTARPGDEFEVVARVKLTEDGMVKVCALDGISLEKEEEPEEMETEVTEEQVSPAGEMDIEQAITKAIRP